MFGGVLKFNESEDKLNSYQIDVFAPLFKWYEECEKSEFDIRIVMSFVRSCYQARILIEFDWKSWEEGLNSLEVQDFKEKDLQFLCMGLTAIIRRDRFIENYLVNQMKKGTIEKLLNEIKNYYV